VIGPPDVYPETGDKAGSWCIADTGVGHFVEVKLFTTSISVSMMLARLIFRTVYLCQNQQIILLINTFR